MIFTELGLADLVLSMYSYVLLEVVPGCSFYVVPIINSSLLLGQVEDGGQVEEDEEKPNYCG